MQNAEPSHTRRRTNSAEPAQTSRLFLFLSLSVNLGLVLFLAVVSRRSASPEVSRNSLPDNTNATSERSRPETKRFATRKISNSPWKQLESADLAIYAANLRAAGCPPKTVRDILLPLLEERFENLNPSVTEPTNFWASFSQRQAAAAAKADQESAMEKERDKAITELFGFAWNSVGLKLAYAGETAGSIGFLDYEHAETLVCIAERFNTQFSREENLRRIDRRLAIYQAWRQEASEVLSPSEFEEAELRAILMIWQRRNPNLCKIGISGAELRQLMTFRRELCSPLPSVLLTRSDELLQEPDWNGDQLFHARARSLLGDDRFIDYLKSWDASIERTLTALEKVHLPRSRALQLFDLRQESIARAQEIRRLPIRRAEKRAQLATLRQSALEQLSVLSIAAADNPLLKLDQDWLQEIANP